MQNGSLIYRRRQQGANVWEFRWREPGSEGKRRHRRIVLGSTLEYIDECAARQAIAALQSDIDGNDVRTRSKSVTIGQAYSHFRQLELRTESAWRTFSTRNGYDGYLKKWVIPRWGTRTLASIKAGEVEQWMRSLPVARSTCAKIRNVMSVLFNHTIRHGIGSVNPIRLVRQSAKRKKIPLVLTPDEIRKLIAALPVKESTLVFLDAVTGLRMSELFGLKWGDIWFATGEISVIRSIVQQVVGPCKTEASQKPVPMDPCLAEALAAWQEHSKYRSPEDWVFASPKSRGRRPYWGQSIMRNVIRPTAVKLGISRRIGWHTFRHTYSTLLRATGADIKVMQELLRHASARVTLDTYTQAITAQKRNAQSAVVKLLIASGESTN
jgi:integrase